MKKAVTRLAVFLAIIAVLSIYILYVLENLPSILPKDGEKDTSDKSEEQLLPGTGADNEQLPASAGDSDSNIPSDDTENNNTIHDNAKTFDSGSDVTGKSVFEHRGERPNDTEPNQNVAVEDEIWRAINRAESYNNELQFYTQDNVTLKDGSITIITKKENKGIKNYTSGMVQSKYGYLYGFFSFRIRVPEGKGLFPAIWLLPVEDKRLPEIDVFEMIGSEPFDFYGVIHYGITEKPQREYFCHKVTKKEFYDVSIRWTKNELSWYIDEQQVFSTDKGIPNEPMYIIVNQAIGGNWPGTPDDTALPATFIVESCKLEPDLIIEI